MLGWGGTTPEAKELLRGNIDPTTITGIDRATTEILKILSQPIEGIQPIDNRLTIDDMSQGFKNWKETTSTSPSGRHLGHYKATLAYPHLEETEDENGNAIIPPSIRIMGAVTKLADMAIRHGLVLDRWCNVTNVMIEKIPGKPMYNKLRVIHLFEADFNLALGILWGRRLMRQAERINILGEQQFGSRKGRCAEDVALLKMITCELINITKTDGGTFDNDAKACYDRIIINLMSMCAQQLGMPPESAELQATILLLAKYRLKTALGLLVEF